MAMRRLFLALLMVATVIGGVWGASDRAAAERGHIAAGLGFRDGKSYGFAAGELHITDGFSLALEHYSRSLTLSGWYGRGTGIYGEITWSTRGGSTKAWEAGLWKSMGLTPRLNISGWVGALRLRGKSPTWLSVNGEATYALQYPLFLLVRAGTYKLDPDKYAGWVGVGYSF